MKRLFKAKFNSKTGFTLVELLVVIVIIAILMAMAFVALKPAKRIREARNSVRWEEVESILQAVLKYTIDNNGTYPSGLDTNYRMLGTDGSGCNIDCITGGEIEYHNASETLNYYSNVTYTVRNWFSASSLPDFDELNASAVLDCDGSCYGNVGVRIGNSTTWTDFVLVDASTVRTDGTTSDYTWYSNDFAMSKSVLGDYFFVQLLLYTGSGTMRFMMDESGPLGPDPEYRTGSNGDGSQTGWTNDNGDYFIKIKTGVGGTTESACLDLTSDLVDTYLAQMPQDPKDGTSGKTYYAIQKSSGDTILVIACHAEESQEIYVTR